MEIIVFGSGCKKCEELETFCRTIAQTQGVEAHIRKISDMDEMINHGVLLTPALMINGKLLRSGKVPTRATLENWIKKTE